MANRFRYPPCNVNPETERPYNRHAWVIKQDVLDVKPSSDELIYYYHIVCKRCGFKDPKKVTH
jgi:hypothetical protein